MPDLTGQTLLRRYHIDTFLGRGGMAEVYRAWDAKRSVHVALKLLNEDLAEDYVFLRRFAREAQALELLQHPNIIRFFGFEEGQSLAFLVMEYIDGVTLRRRLRDLGRPLTLPETLAVLQPVCSALHYAHGMGVYHCDVKPANVFIESGGRVVLGDFGIVRLSESATTTFSTPGTPAYMAPEQCRGREVDARTDIYSLGITAYEMLTLDRPFKGDTEETTGSRGERVRWEQIHLPARRPGNVNPSIPPSAEAAILRALEKDPDRRQQQVLHFCRELSAGGQVQPAAGLPSPILDRPSTPPEPVEGPGKPILPGRRVGLGIALGLIALSVLFVATLLIFSGGGEKDQTATLVAELAAVAQTATAGAVSQATHLTALPPSPEGPSSFNQTVEPEIEVASPEPTDTPEPVAISTPMPSPTPTATPLPTPTPSPTPTPLPTSTPTPACPGVSGPFAGVWSAVQGRIGCAAGSHYTTWAAEETFEKGWMYWRKDNDKIYAVYNWGVWGVYDDIWHEGEPDFSCSDANTPSRSPPTPLRGFGKVWCTYPAVRQGLGWATEGERGFDVIAQHFQRGFILRTDRWTWVFYEDGTWERR
jgi:serine/threonine protein kinase